MRSGEDSGDDRRLARYEQRLGPRVPLGRFRDACEHCGVQAMLLVGEA